MNVVSKTRLRQFWAVHPHTEGPLTKWHAATSKAVWTCFDDVRKTYRKADPVNEFVVFDINGFRIICSIAYQVRFVYIKHVFTHEAYDQWTAQQRKRK